MDLVAAPRERRAFEYALTFYPIVSSSLVIALASLSLIAYRLTLPYPMDPWEAGIATDAWRMVQGQMVYGVGTDHATHIARRRLVIQREIATADYVIVIEMPPPYTRAGGEKLPANDILQASGFQKSVFRTVSSSAYSLWRRVGSP